MSAPGFRPLAGNRDCEDCVALHRVASRNGDVLTFVREATDDYPLAVRVYVHPDCLDLASLSEADRGDFRGPWFPACPNRCEVRDALSLDTDLFVRGTAGE
jgi:hypothetical protein